MAAFTNIATTDGLYTFSTSWPSCGSCNCPTGECYGRQVVVVSHMPVAHAESPEYRGLREDRKRFAKVAAAVEAKLLKRRAQTRDGWVVRAERRPRLTPQCPIRNYQRRLGRPSRRLGRAGERRCHEEEAR